MDRLTLILRSSLIWVVILYLEPIANGVFNAAFTMGGGAYTECINEKGGITLVSGCLGAVFTNNLLLIQCRPNQPPFPFINGEHCTGDAMAVDKDIGTRTIVLEWVPVYPIGMEKPDDPDDKINFLADEALHSVRGLVSDAQGNLFASKLGRRDYLTGGIWKNKPTFRLALYKAVFDEIVWHCKHYTGYFVMKFYESGAALAQDKMEETVATQYQDSLQTTKDADGGPFPAYTSEKSWDEASYQNVISGAAFAVHSYYVAIAIHYCKGCLEYDENSAMMGTDFQPIPGFYVAGEAAGDMPGLRSGGRMHDTKYTSGGEVVPTSRAFVPRRDHRSGLSFVLLFCSVIGLTLLGIAKEPHC